MSVIARRYEPHTDRGVGALDLASAYLRVNAARVVGRYLLAVLPLFVAAWLWIDTVTAQDRLALPMLSGLLLAAIVWRWAGLAWVQAAVLRDLNMPVKLTIGRLACAVIARLAGHIAMTWGSVLILPAIWGFYFAAFSPIISLDPKTRTGAALKQSAKLVWSNLSSLWKLAAVMVVLMGVLALSIMLVQVLLLGTVLPSLMGIDTTDLQLASSGPAWWLCLGLLAWACFDFDLPPENQSIGYERISCSRTHSGKAGLLWLGLVTHRNRSSRSCVKRRCCSARA